MTPMVLCNFPGLFFSGEALFFENFLFFRGLGFFKDFIPRLAS